MGKVQILPADLVAKIAAGEVIERPASVVKELVENSLDAGATSIQVELQDAGKTLIRVKDNGSGIDEDDLTRIFSRHATSKLASTDDLTHILSLGFRGEALYSIGAVSDSTLRSKPAAATHGWEVHLRGNEQLSRTPVNLIGGTEIEVRELFYNTPARRKFLKATAAELNYILDLLLPYALLYPEREFILLHDRRPCLSLAPASSLIERITRALHLEATSLIEETREFMQDGFFLHLVLGDSNIVRTRKDMQFIFVNKRPVESRALSYHLNDIYRMLLAPGVYPFFALFLEIDPADVDVNVHPTKRQVKLKNEAAIGSALRACATQLLMNHSKATQAKEKIFTLNAPSAKTTDAPPLPPQLTMPPKALVQEMFAVENQALAPAALDQLTPPAGDLKAKLQQGRYLGNLLATYLLFESPDSLLVMDQHAAAERIAFERLTHQFEQGAPEVQELLSPLLLKLSPQELVLWEENQEVFTRMGFSCSLFDRQTLALHAYPPLLSRPEVSVRNLLAGESIGKMDPSQLARLACRSSVMAGEVLNKEKAEYQRDQLLLCANAFTCPHGRPTVIELRRESLARQFLR